MKDAKPIIVLWCMLALLVGVVAAVRAIQKAGMPTSRMTVVYNTNGMAITMGINASQSSNLVTLSYDANGERIIDTNSSPLHPMAK